MHAAFLFLFGITSNIAFVEVYLLTFKRTRSLRLLLLLCMVYLQLGLSFFSQFV